MKKQKVAIVCPCMLPIPSVKGGAIETLIDHIINENEYNDKIDLLIYSTYDIKANNISKQYKNTQFVYTKYNKKIFNKYFLLSKGTRKNLNFYMPIPYFDKIINHLKKQNVDKIVVQANSYFVEYLYKKLPEKDIYLHIHSDDFCIYNSRQDKTNQICKKVILVSEFLKNQAKKARYKTENMIVLKNCVDDKIFSKEVSDEEKIKLRQKLGIKDDDKVILFTGRILEIKGVRELILAFKLFLEKDNKVKLLIVGNAGFGEEVKNKYDEELITISKEITDNIIFTGFVSNKEISKIHAICDIAVVPSLCEEAAGLVVLEAMKSGLPLIVTDSGGIHEYICKDYVIEVKRGKNIVFNIYTAIDKLLNNKDLMILNSEKSKEYSKKFNTNKFYNDFIEIIND